MRPTNNGAFTWHHSPHPQTVIEIVEMPDGESPEWVRRHWVGLKFLVSLEGVHDVETIGVLSAPRTRFGWWLARRLGRTEVLRGYFVNERVAIEGLVSRDAEAGKSWVSKVRNLEDAGSNDIIFEERVCRVVKPGHPDPANT